MRNSVYGTALIRNTFSNLKLLITEDFYFRIDISTREHLSEKMIVSQVKFIATCRHALYRLMMIFTARHHLWPWRNVDWAILAAHFIGNHLPVWIFGFCLFASKRICAFILICEVLTYITHARTHTHAHWQILKC